MFEELRYNLKHNRKGVIRTATAWFLFGAIIVVFIFLGMNPQGQGFGEGGAATQVNDDAISLAEYTEAVERLRRDPRFEQFQSLGGDAGRQILQQQAISQLIEMELIQQATAKQRIMTSDAEVRDIITGIEAFRENVQFRRERYLGYLEQTRRSPAEFEDEIRREQALRRTVRMFGAALRPLPQEGEKLKSLTGLRANVEYVTVPTESLVIPESVREADVTAYLAKPESASKVKDYYETHKQEFSTPERVKARHILVRATPEDPESDKKALTKVQDLAKRAKTEDFVKLATEASDDPGSKAKGGLIDYFSRGQMVPEFEEYAFSAKPNEISEPIKTQFGYHLVQVVDKQAAKEKSLEEAREDIAQKLIASERSKTAVAGLQEALKNGDRGAIESFVSAHGLKWEETGPFSADAETLPKLGSNDEIMTLAFTLTPEKPIAPTLVREGATGRIVRYKAVAGKAPDAPAQSPELMSEMAAGRRSEDALKQWIDGLRKTAKISVNPQVQGAN